MNFIKKSICFWLLFVCFAPHAQAQLRLTPNQTNYQKTALPTNQGEKTSLLLPFFDDFSDYKGSPNSNLWLVPSGVWVNQSFGYNPVSVGVATFDGLKANGSPYSFSTVTVDAVGTCDTLTSKPIELGTFSPPDAVYLSFFWQEQGFGERPDVTDSLYVEFLDNTNTWRYVWGKLGGNPTADFKAAVIAVNDTKYFHSNFQFRIVGFGRQSGMYDVWHVDYVYLNKNRAPQDTLVEEIATSQIRKSFLKKYTAMPLEQYFANPAQETSDSLTATLNNLSGTGFDVVSYKMVLEDALTNTVLNDLGTTSPFILGGTQRQFGIGRKMPTNPIAPTTQKLAVRSKLIAITGDGTTTIPPIDLRKNDTLSTVNMLHDYLAYDDGSAEYGAGVNQRFGRVAIRFVLNAPDVLTDVHFHLTKFEKDLSIQSFNLVIWKHLTSINPNAVRDSVMYKLVVPIRYPTQRDQLLSAEAVRKQVEPTFKFPILALPAGEFYIGWEQTTNDLVTVGYDRNTNSVSDIFFNSGNRWNVWEAPADETGSLLFRPVFSNDYLTAREPESRQAPYRLYPNPAESVVYLEGNLPTQIQITDLQGRVLATHTVGRQVEKMAIPVEKLPKGLYLLRGTMPNGKTYLQKLAVSR